MIGLDYSLSIIIILALIDCLVQMANYSELFGSTLLSNEGEVTVSSLSGKVVGLYFS
jgi:hypothetical protein